MLKENDEIVSLLAPLFLKYRDPDEGYFRLTTTYGKFEYCPFCSTPIGCDE